ncbi:MAG: GNAT family N-acetyltransferase [Muribaculaceae bacterium]|nr:GNAT family N-acetyltransferase [Muribaculaceae bacterium]
MNAIELKKKFSQLWKDTFHDSDAYISLVMDNYFHPEYCLYEEANGELTGALMGVPYEFGNEDNKISGLYLCGLATKPQYRSRGIMTRLLSAVNSKARKDGFAFTFLIPADDGLRKYYRDRDYVNAFYRVIDNYTSLHNFDLEYEADLQLQKEKVADMKRRYFSSLITREYNTSEPCGSQETEKVVRMILDIQNRQLDLQIYHSEEDLHTIIAENRLSGGSMVVTSNSQGIVTAAAFIGKSEEELKIDIYKLYTTDLTSKFKLLSYIKEKYADYGIRLYISLVDMDRKALWSRTYGSYMGEAPQVASISSTESVYSLAAHSKVYGMARVLNLYEILKFQARQRHDLKYSILAKGDEFDTYDRFDVKDGHINIKELTGENLSPSQLAYVMSKRDIAEIVFRRRDTDNLVTEAFGIPSINGSISLMLD